MLWLSLFLITYRLGSFVPELVGTLYLLNDLKYPRHYFSALEAMVFPLEIILTVIGSKVAKGRGLSFIFWLVTLKIPIDLFIVNVFFPNYHLLEGNIKLATLILFIVMILQLTICNFVNLAFL